MCVCVYIYGAIDSMGMTFFGRLEAQGTKYCDTELCVVVGAHSKRKNVLMWGGGGWRLIKLSLLGDNDHN